MAVELNVRSELGRIIGELEQLQTAAGKVGDELGKAGDEIGDGLNKKAKDTEGYLAQLQNFGGRVASQLTRDFKALLSVNALAGSLKFSEMFRGSISETVTLSDSIRKLGSTLGLASREMSRFQEAATKTMAQVGLSSEAAAGAIGGLAETPVRGQKNLLAYMQTAGQLASVSREGGREGDIAKGLSRVVTARGGSPNDLSQMKAVSDDVLRIRQATGKSATEVLSSMEQLFSNANKSFQQRLRGGGAVTLATAALVGGQDATGFLEKYLSSNVFQRFGSNAQGLGGIVNKSGGLDLSQMESVLREARGRGMGDEQAGLSTMGLSDEEAKGFMRLTEALRQNKDVVDGARTRQVDLNATYRESMGLSEAFKGSLNRVKGLAAGPLAYATQKGTDLLSGAAQSNVGALGITAGAGVLAAVLTGGGIRGIAKAAGVEQVTGRQVQPVFVTNFPGGFGVGEGLGGLAKGGGIAGALGTAGLIGAAGFAVGGAAIAAGLSNEKKLSGEALEPLNRAKAYDEDQKRILQEISAGIQQIKVVNGNGRVSVELNKKELRETKPQSRGGSFGPTNF